MKVLLDECVDRRLARHVTGHDVTTVPEAGWAGLKNGGLLKRAQEQFDVFVTIDRNLPFSVTFQPSRSPSSFYVRKRTASLICVF